MYRQAPAYNAVQDKGNAYAGGIGMLYITEDQKRRLKNLVSNADDLLQAAEIGKFLIRLDREIAVRAAKGNEPEESIAALQRIYDEVYLQNVG